MVKFFAKVCDIGDASRGSLSSYAYVLMLIYYLQQCNHRLSQYYRYIHTVLCFCDGKTSQVHLHAIVYLKYCVRIPDIVVFRYPDIQLSIKSDSLSGRINRVKVSG